MKKQFEVKFDELMILKLNVKYKSLINASILSEIIFIIIIIII